MISISSPYDSYDSSPFCSDVNKVTAILSLAFVDAEADDIERHIFSEEDLMTDQAAYEVASFLDSHLGKDIIVHCDAGISRSAGIAAAILYCHNGDDSQIFDNIRY